MSHRGRPRSITTVLAEMTYLGEHDAGSYLRSALSQRYTQLRLLLSSRSLGEIGTAARRRAGTHELSSLSLHPKVKAGRRLLGW